MGSGRRVDGPIGDGSATEIHAYEASLHPERRRSSGVHYTPIDLAGFLSSRALDKLDAEPQRVCDPTCGSGAFLLAAAEALADLGVDPVEIVERRLFGADVDGEALHVCRRVLANWASERSGSHVSADRVGGLVLADLLGEPPGEWADIRFDLIVGNPPFLSQLRSRTTRSRAVAETLRGRHQNIGAYADSAAVILLVAAGMLAAGGVATMIQPQSFLSARGTAGVRDTLLDQTDLLEVWSSDEAYFDASVRVCAVTVLKQASGADPRRRSRSTEVVWSGGGRSVNSPVTSQVPVPRPGESWGPLFAAAVGLPVVEPSGGMRIGDIATATAGFRDEFYALVDACVEDPEGRPRLITVGMIDPGHLSWGVRSRRLGGVGRLTPTVDAARLGEASPGVQRWVAGRLVPKVLVATQTRIIEAAVDETGDCVPVTPVISVEPRPGWAASLVRAAGLPVGAEPDLWWILAALSAPAVAARAVAQHLGTGLSGGALRVSARSVVDFELPTDAKWWARGAEAARNLAAAAAEDRPAGLASLGAAMCRAHGHDPSGALFEWWLERAAAACSS